jgi:TfoX/Sxy family transcriptional regulator of competence genes
LVWEKVSTELSELLEKALISCDCQKRQMFGCPAYFVNNNMFTGVHQSSLFIRLSEVAQKELLVSNPDVTKFEPMAGRIMKEYIVLPESIYNDSKALSKWLNRSYEYVLSLPLKETKQKVKKKADI